MVIFVLVTPNRMSSLHTLATIEILGIIKVLMQLTLIATLTAFHSLVSGFLKIVLQPSVAVVLPDSETAIASKLASTLAEITAEFWFANVVALVADDVLVNIVTSVQQTMRLLSINGLICIPFVHAVVELSAAKIVLTDEDNTAPAAPTAVVCKKFLRELSIMHSFM